MRILALIAACCLLAGCATGGEDASTAKVDLRRLVTILPTPAGVGLAGSEARTADAAAVQAALAGTAKAESARQFEERGFKAGAIRRWSGPDGASFLVVVSRWPDHTAAIAIGAGAAELPLDQRVPGARAWDPAQARGSRGTRVDGPGRTSRLLSFAVSDISLFVRSDGAVGEEPVVRAIQRMTRQIEQAI